MTDFLKMLGKQFCHWVLREMNIIYNRSTRRGVKSGLKVKQKRRAHYDKHTFLTQSRSAFKNDTYLNVCQ